MKEKISPKLSMWLIFLIMSASLFSTLLTGEPQVQISTAPESSPAPVPVIQPMTLEQLQEMIAQNGFAYTVGETWVSELPPEEFANLLGYVPPPMDLSHVIAPPEEMVQYPSKFDWRNTGDVTPPRNQGSCGSCWAFAGIGDLESSILIEGGPAYDLSEENALSCNAHGVGCTGGNDIYLANYLTQAGAALESCAPYDARDGTACKTSCVNVRKVSGYRVIGTGLDNPTAANINAIKSALMSYGPLWVTMDASAPGFSAYTGGVFEYWLSTTVNHAVLLIGWDDTLRHSHGYGAWIVKNSWGTYWGEGGYFKIAFGSAKFGNRVSAYSSTRGFYYNEKMFYYDERGWVGSFSYQPYDTWGAVRFVPTANGRLERVDFWVVANGLNYQIYVYDSIGGSNPYTFSGLLASQSGSVTQAGYCSVELNTKPLVTSGNDIVIAVRFTFSAYQWPVPYDNSPLVSGQSYYSADGSTWRSLSLDGYPWDIGIRGVVRGSTLLFSGYPGYFSSNSFFVVGNEAYCTDVLGTGKIAYGLAKGGILVNPEGRTHTILTSTEHATGNLMIVGGPAINPLAVEFGDIFGVQYVYNPGVSFDILCEGEHIYLNLAQYPQQDVCVIYVGDQNARNAMLVWGYGWQGTYAGSVFMGEPTKWQSYPNAHLLLLRWTDSNADGLVQIGEITVEAYS